MKMTSSKTYATEHGVSIDEGLNNLNLVVLPYDNTHNYIPFCK